MSSLLALVSQLYVSVLQVTREEEIAAHATA